MVRAGTSLTFQVQGQTASYLPPDSSSLRASVIAFLSAYFFVEAVEVTTRGAAGRIMAGEFWNYDYSAIVTVSPRSDYGAVRDVGSVIQHAFYAASGGMPTVSTDFNETIGGTGSTPTPRIPVLDTIEDLPKLIIVGIVIIVGLIVFSPTGKALGQAGVKLS